MPVKRRRGSNCDQETVAKFDYSSLGAEFRKLARPAQRALVNNKIFTVTELSRRGLKIVAQYHGIGASAIKTLQSILRKNGLEFKKS